MVLSSGFQAETPRISVEMNQLSDAPVLQSAIELGRRVCGEACSQDVMWSIIGSDCADTVVVGCGPHPPEDAETAEIRELLCRDALDKTKESAEQAGLVVASSDDDNEWGESLTR